jgi:crotonobetainyl-CoA:carnitine CoA-transferase CaiB-like acyl-CoA transferase
MPGIPVSDYLSALQGLSGVLMALLARQSSGRGDFIDISMQETLLSATSNVMGPTLAEGRQPVVAHERTTGGGAFYRWYECADGRMLAIAGQEKKFIEALLGHLGRLDLAPLCDTPGPHQQPVVDLLRAAFAGMTLDDAGALLDRLDVCWGPVKTYPEALADEQVVARGFITTDALGRRHIGTPIRFRNEPGRPDWNAPRLGENQEIVG